MNHDFCRTLLKETTKEISPRKFSVCKTSFGDYTVAGPNEAYWWGRACCKWEAKAKAINEYLTRLEMKKQLNKRSTQ